MKARSPGLSSGQAEPWMAEREGRERVGMHAIPTRRVRERPALWASERFEYLHPAMEGSCCFFNGGEGGIRTLVTR